MANDKLNPAALNPKWGGVICLELGNEKPDNFDEIYQEIKNAVESQLYYLVGVYDTVDNIYIGSCRIGISTTTPDSYFIRGYVLGATNVSVRQYVFRANGNYGRTTDVIK